MSSSTFASVWTSPISESAELTNGSSLSGIVLRLRPCPLIAYFSVQIVQQIIGPNGEIQQIPIQLSPQQLQVRAYLSFVRIRIRLILSASKKNFRIDVISAELWLLNNLLQYLWNKIQKKEIYFLLASWKSRTSLHIRNTAFFFVLLLFPSTQSAG
jgi:hypothetical protein